MVNKSERIFSENIGGYVIGIFIVLLVISGWNWYKDYTNKPEFFETDGLSSYTSEKRKGWELWIYSTNTPNTDYTIDEARGLSKDVCMAEGLARTRDGGSFQCGKNCYTNMTQIEDFEPNTIEVCEIMCEKSGCRD